MADTRGTILVVDDEPATVERKVIRFAHGPGDIGAETAGRLDEHMARARRSVGLS